MTKGFLLIAFLSFFTINPSQDTQLLKELRLSFQKIDSEEDIQRILDWSLDPDDPNVLTAKSYQAASKCMMAEYVVSPVKKLKYFNQGKTSLEELIAEEKSVEKVYLRLLIQMNVPRLLNYNKNIEEDIAFLEVELPNAKIDVDYKYTMIRNLVTLADKDQVKEVLLGIKMTGTEEKL